MTIGEFFHGLSTNASEAWQTVLAAPAWLLWVGAAIILLGVVGHTLSLAGLRPQDARTTPPETPQEGQGQRRHWPGCQGSEQ